MKINLIVVLPIILTFSLIATGCTSNNNDPESSQVINSQVKNTTASKQEVSIDKSNDDPRPEKYATFFSYPYQHGMEIQPGMGGTLVMREGCLLLQSDGRLNVPVFPHGITTWNEDTQVLSANGVNIPLNSELFTNGPLDGGAYDPSYDYGFEQQADPKCLENRNIQFLGSQFIDVKELPNQ